MSDTDTLSAIRDIVKQWEDGQFSPRRAMHSIDAIASIIEGAAFASQPPAASQPNAALAEQALLDVLNIVRRYLPPDGISVQDATCEIIACVDPWPLATPPAASQPSGGCVVTVPLMLLLNTAAPKEGQ